MAKKRNLDRALEDIINGDIYVDLEDDCNILKKRACMMRNSSVSSNSFSNDNNSEISNKDLAHTIDDDDAYTFRVTNKGVPPFLLNLRQMCDDPKTNDLISWTDDGLAVAIKNEFQFASTLLPLNFKHDNLSSFVRQLNSYGFQKALHYGNPNRKGKEFFHPFFQRGRRDLQKQIRRKNSNKPFALTTQRERYVPNNYPHLVESLEGLRVGQNIMSSAMRKQNKALQSEVDDLKHDLGVHKQIIEKLMQSMFTLAQATNNITAMNPLLEAVGLDSKLRTRSNFTASDSDGEENQSKKLFENGSLSEGSNNLSASKPMMTKAAFTSVIRSTESISRDAESEDYEHNYLEKKTINNSKNKFFDFKTGKWVPIDYVPVKNEYPDLENRDMLKNFAHKIVGNLPKGSRESDHLAQKENLEKRSNSNIRQDNSQYAIIASRRENIEDENDASNNEQKMNDSNNSEHSFSHRLNGSTEEQSFHEESHDYPPRKPDKISAKFYQQIKEEPHYGYEKQEEQNSPDDCHPYEENFIESDSDSSLEHDLSGFADNVTESINQEDNQKPNQEDSQESKGQKKYSSPPKKKKEHRPPSSEDDISI